MNYLSVYSNDPLSKDELVNHMFEQIMKRYDITEKFRIKRQGKDADDFYWMFEKIHGLENLAFVDPEKILEAKGNPVAIQELAN